MGKPVIVEAVRTPIGKRNGWLSGLKATEPLRHAQLQVIARAGIDPAIVDEVIGGCVTQAGEQGSNVTRNAWLSAGKPLPFEAACTTVDTQCGSAQQANHLIAGLIAAGGIDVGIACGVEADEPRAAGLNVINGPGPQDRAVAPTTCPTASSAPPSASPSSAASPARTSTSGASTPSARRSRRGTRAASSGRSRRSRCPVLGEDGQPTGETQLIARDQGLRDTTMESLAKLKPVVEGYKHTAGTARRSPTAPPRCSGWTRTTRRQLGLTPPGPHRAPGRDRHRSLLPARRPGRRDPQGARPGGHGDERLRPLRGQRGLRRRSCSRGRRSTSPTWTAST